MAKHPLVLVLPLALTSFHLSWAHDHSHPSDASSVQIQSVAAPEPAAQGNAATGNNGTALKQRWETADKDLHDYLDQLQERLKDRKGNPVYQLAHTLDCKMHLYAQQNLGSGPGDQECGIPPLGNGGSQAGSDQDRIYQDLINAVNAAKQSGDYAEKLKDVTDQLKGGKPTNLSREELSKRQESLNRSLDQEMTKNMPQDWHGFVMPAIAGPLKKIGFEMGGHKQNIENQGANAPLLNFVAKDDLISGDFQGAERAAQKALVMDPGNAEAWATLAGAQYHMNDFPGALQSAKAALIRDPSNKEAAAIVNLFTGRTAPASAYVNSTEASAQAAPETSRVSSRAAAAAPGQTSAASSNELSSMMNRALGKMELRDFQGAEKDLTRALTLSPNDLNALFYRAMARMRQGNLKDALADADAALAVPSASKNAAVMNAKARILNRMKDYQGAKSLALEILRQTNQKDADAWYNLANAEWGLGDRAKMLQALGNAAENNRERYGARYDEAQRQPNSADLSFLFDDNSASAKNALAGSGGGPSGRSASRGALLMILGMLIGGFLVALGALRGLSSSWTRRWTRGAKGASAEAPPMGAGEEAPGLAVGAFPGAPSQRPVGGVYQIVRQIGAGGMGVVYEAMDRSLGRRVAVKKMREEIRVDPRERDRFLKEARTVAAMRHPNIVDIYSIVEDGPDIYLVFEYVEGRTLSDAVSEHGRMSFAEGLEIFKGACAALEYAHGRGVIHRDLKPSNIMVDGEGKVKVMDFGVARQAKDAASRISMTNTVVGTPPYMAPEQEQGMVCKESDVYALGVCLYEMLTGRMPFAGTGAGLLLNKMNKAYTAATALAPELPAGVDQALALALEPDPEKRVKTPREFLKLVETVGAAR